MKKVNELRIGNWVCDFGINRKVDGEFIKRLSEIELTGKIAINVSFIELSPDILIKCGYKRNGNLFTNRLTIGDIDTVNGAEMYIKSYGDVSFAFWVCSDYYNSYCIEIKYLHQLQNLYFALTGEELTLKP